jgi:hypothetical protein
MCPHGDLFPPVRSNVRYMESKELHQQRVLSSDTYEASWSEFDGNTSFRL